MIGVGLALSAVFLGGDGSYQPPRDFGEQIDRYVAPLVAAHDFGGVILVAQGGKVLFDKAYGYASFADGIRNKPQTRFGIGSISKQFTAAAILFFASGASVPS